MVDPNGQPLNAAPGAIPAANGAAPVANQPAAAQPPANQPANAAPVGGAAAGGAVAPAGGAPVFTQASPVTTVFEPTTINGVVTQVAVVYSQKFSSVPDQGPSPAAGSVGMGTLTGAVGVVKTDAVKAGAAGRDGVMLGMWALGVCVSAIMVWT